VGSGKVSLDFIMADVSEFACFLDLIASLKQPIGCVYQRRFVLIHGSQMGALMGFFRFHSSLRI